jgi:putative exosortase-associated protein (TIGR04073 family)
MYSFRRFTVSLTCVGIMTLAFAPRLWADNYQQQVQNEKLFQHDVARQKQFRQQQYERLVEKKAINGATNIATGFLEIPKNMINITNEEDSNIVYGIIGGGIRGLIDTIGRMTVGTMDLLTAPLPTKPVVYPRYVWDDFDKTNIYDKVFRLDESYKTATLPPIQPVTVVKPRLPVLDNSTEAILNDTNRRLDSYFENTMRK